MDEEFRKIFEKFSFTDVAASEETDKKDEVAENAVTKKKAGSDSDSDDEENEQEEKGLGCYCSRSKVGDVFETKALVSKEKIFAAEQLWQSPMTGTYSHMTFLHNINGHLFVTKGKHGIEKQPFQLPDFIASTGIEKIRQFACSDCSIPTSDGRK
ncbi:splicing factor 3B subunit 2-like isoform X2 [Trifolium pratense]|uniref:splicing factor 3B subunit 2-like isoform X2 n=1 Tax=Trifolium pratense TaxID=57577 RepID=UPI001E694213|nr:splicing factor 3B subunit 2-like isoform X2 [Trifolium pratense]